MSIGHITSYSSTTAFSGALAKRYVSNRVHMIIRLLILLFSASALQARECTDNHSDWKGDNFIEINIIDYTEDLSEYVFTVPQTVEEREIDFFVLSKEAGGHPKLAVTLEPKTEDGAAITRVYLSEDELVNFIYRISVQYKEKGSTECGFSHSVPIKHNKARNPTASPPVR